MHIEDKENFNFFLKKVHSRLRKPVLKVIEQIKQRRKKNYISSWILSMIIFSSTTIFTLLKNITSLDKVHLIIFLLLANVYYYAKYRSVVSYEKSVEKNFYYINKYITHHDDIIVLERLTCEELQILFSLYASELEIKAIMQMIKEKNYLTYKDLYDINDVETIYEVEHWGMVDSTLVNRSLQIREQIEKYDKELLLNFEKYNHVNLSAPIEHQHTDNNVENPPIETTLIEEILKEELSESINSYIKA